jgi:hypothetical protein
MESLQENKSERVRECLSNAAYCKKEQHRPQTLPLTLGLQTLAGVGMSLLGAGVSF